MEKETILISECLLGISCRMDGKAKPLPEDVLSRLIERYHLVPVCPEILGGLSTPRDPSEIQNGRVFSKSGLDVTSEFCRGAEETLKLAELFHAKRAIFKEKSPSCGSERIYDGTFSGVVVPGDGMASALLKEHGVTIIGDTQVESLLD